MGTNLKKELKSIIELILSKYDNWDNSLEEGLNIAQENVKSFNRLKEIDSFLKIETDKEILELYEKLLDAHKLFLKKLNELKHKLELERQQLLKKDKIKDNYIAKKLNPVFIDKDL